jgi:hypothetical protein
MTALLALVLATAPLGVPAPLGDVSSVVTEPPKGGVPSDQAVVVTRLDHCEKPRAIWLRRYLLAATEAASDVQAFLNANGKKPLAKTLGKAIAKARGAAATDALACVESDIALREGWKTDAFTAPSSLCKGERGPASAGGAWFFLTTAQLPPDQKNIAGWVQLTPPASGPSADAGPDELARCGPRLSAVLYDDAGAARFRYHADFGGALTVEVLGDGCKVTELSLDSATGMFTPTERKAGPPCGAAVPKKAK